MAKKHSIAFAPSAIVAGFRDYARLDTIKTQLLMIMPESEVKRVVHAAADYAVSGKLPFIDSVQYGYELAMSGKSIDEIETVLKS